jgi:hypothetical protein
MPQGAPAHDSASSLDFYRAKFVVTTTSDWTSVRVESGAVVATLKLQVLEGKEAPALSFGSDTGRGVIAEIDKKQYDTTLVRIEVLATLADVRNNTDLTGVIEKGALGHTLVAVFNQNRESAVALSSFNDIIKSGERNAYRFSIHGKDLMAGGPHSVPRYLSRRLILAFYYPWYSTSDWQPPKMKDLPLSGAYSSNEDETISRHIRLAKSAGIDGFIVSWWGPNSQSDNNFRRILAWAEKLDLKVTIYHENSEYFKRTRLSYLRDIKYVLDTYSKSPAFLKLDGTPVIFTYTVSVLPLEDYRSVKSELQQQGYIFVNIGDTLDPQYLDVFDGLHTYVVPDSSANLTSTYDSASLATKSYSVIAGGQTRKIWAATICPGWDLRSIPWGGPTLFGPREDAAYYNSTFKAAMASEPDWLLITSFNEWWENTEIEPSKTYGYKYVDVTTAYASEMKQTRYLPFLQASRTVSVEGQVAELHVAIENTGNGSAINMITQDATLAGGENTTRIIDRLLPGEETHYAVKFNISPDQLRLNISPGEISLKDAYGNLYMTATNPVLKHHLAVVSPYGSTSGTGWYDPNVIAPFSVSPTSLPVSGVMGMLGVKYIFEGWSGDQPTKSSNATVVMDGPKAVTALWRRDYTQLYVTIGASMALIAFIAMAVYARRKTRDRSPRAPKVAEAVKAHLTL